MSGLMAGDKAVYKGSHCLFVGSLGLRRALRYGKCGKVLDVNCQTARMEFVIGGETLDFIVSVGELTKDDGFWATDPLGRYYRSLSRTVFGH